MTFLGAGGGIAALGPPFVAAGAATIDLTGIITPAYDVYNIVGWLRPATDGAHLQGRLSQDNGVTWDTGYASGRANLNPTSWASSYTAAGDQFDLSHGAGNLSSEYLVVNIYLYCPANGDAFTTIANCAPVILPSGFPSSYMANAKKNTGDVDNAIQFFFNSGDIADSKLTAYGRVVMAQ